MVGLGEYLTKAAIGGATYFGTLLGSFGAGLSLTSIYYYGQPFNFALAYSAPSATSLAKVLSTTIYGTGLGALFGTAMCVGVFSLVWLLKSEEEANDYLDTFVELIVHPETLVKIVSYGTTLGMAVARGDYYADNCITKVQNYQRTTGSEIKRVSESYDELIVIGEFKLIDPNAYLATGLD